jgi:hypothetical protein
MPDKMPFRLFAPDLLYLTLGLLNLVFAKNGLPGGNRFSYSFGRMGFAYGDKLYIAGATSRTPSDGLDPKFYTNEIVPQ